MTGKTLLVGSYPPVPGPAAAATVAAARRAWAAGREVVVISPRPSAAPLAMRAAGGRAVGRQVARLGRGHGCDGVVLCLEPGWPVWGRGGGDARALAAVLATFATAEVVVTGAPGAGPELAPLWGVASTVWAGSPGLVDALRTAGAVDVRLCDLGEGAPPGLLGLGAVHPVEPGDLLLAARGRRLAGAVARRLLGARAPAVRAQLAGWWRRWPGARNRA